MPRTVEQLQEAPWAESLRFDWSVWNSLIASIPPWVARVMAPGPPKFASLQQGWGATEADDDSGMAADVYYFDKTTSKDTTTKEWNLYWYSICR
jgi:hypothetical protein